MSKIDKMVIASDPTLIKFFKRFIDDIFLLWTGTEEQFLTCMTKINSLHPTIKFTHNYNLEEKSTVFLDTKVSIKNGKLTTDLYRKETDKVQYLLPNSNHPSHIFKNIPFSLALRLVRICSSRVDLQKQLEELKVMLLSRRYNKSVINAAIKKALEVDRQEALKKVVKKQNDRVICSLTFNPKLPSISKVLQKHWKTITVDKKMLNTFPKPPMVAFKQPPTLKNILCRAKLPSKQKPKRSLLGMKPC
jgi:peptide-methionine (R)-S-oxide reductase